MEQWTIINPLDEGIEHADGVTIEGPEGVVATNVLEQHAACIAAVPDLLAALEQVNQRLTSGSAESWQHLHMQVKAVIAKAKGGE